MSTHHLMRETIHRALFCAVVVLTALTAGNAWGQCLTPPGDITGNGDTNIVDIQCSILVTLATLGETSAPDCLTSQDFNDPDLNCDGELSVVDIILNIELAFGNVLAEDTNLNGWVDSCACDLGGGTSTDVCSESTSLDMESLCAAEQGILDSSAGAGVAGSVVICDGEDWWLPEEIKWAKDGSVVSGYGYPCTKEEGCSSNEGYRQTRTRGVARNTAWDSVEVLCDSDGDGNKDYDTTSYVQMSFAIDGKVVEDYCWSISFIKTLYNHTEKACWKTCEEVKEAEYAAAENPEELAASATAYWQSECLGPETNLWQDAISPGGTAFVKTCAWDEWENQTLYLPLWMGITGGHTPTWLGDENIVADPVPTMLEAFRDFCINDALWNCQKEYILYDEDGNPDASGNYFDTTNGDGTTIDTGVSMTATTINLMMTEWVRDDAYAFWHPTWKHEAGQWLKRLNLVIDTYDSNDVVDTFHVIGEGGRWTNYPTIGFRTLDELEGDLNELWTEYSESGLPLEKLMVNTPGGARGHSNSVALAIEQGIGAGVHGAGGLMASTLLMLFPHMTYYDHLKMWLSTETMPFSRLHSDMELFKTPNTLGEYRLLLPLILGSISVGANRFIMSATAIPSYGEAQIIESKCELDGMEPTYDDDGNPEIKGFGPMADGTYQANWEFYQSPDGKDCWNYPSLCNRTCMFNWHAIEDWGAADNLEWMNKMTGRSFTGSPEAYVSFFKRGCFNPTEESLTQLYEDEMSSECDDALNEGYTLNFCQVDECTIDDKVTMCYETRWDTGNLGHLVAANMIQVGLHMAFNPSLEGGGGTPDRQLNGDLYGSVFIDGTGNNLTNYVNGFDYPYEARSTWTSGSTGGDALYFDLMDEFVNTGINLESGDSLSGDSLPDSQGVAIAELPTSAYAIKVIFAPSKLPGPSDTCIKEDACCGVDPDLTGMTETYEAGSDSGQFQLEYHGEAGWTKGPTVCFDATDTGLKTATFHLTDAVFGQGGQNTFIDPELLAGFDLAPEELSDLAIRHVEGAHASIIRIRVIKIP